MAYRVAPGKSIMLPPKHDLPTAVGSLLKAGEIIPDGLFDKREIDKKIQDGYVVAEGAAPVEATAPGGTVPGRSMTEEAIDAKDAPSTGDNAGGTSASSGQQGGVQQSVTKPDESVKTQEASNEQPEVTQDPTPWTFDPASLAGKDLDELRVMILEHEADFDPETIGTIDEAVEYLSQDFKPASTD